MGGTGGRATAPGFALISALTAAGPAMTRSLALELAPIRVNLIAAGFVDTPVYDGARLEPGHILSGPCIVERMGDTIVLPPGASGRVDQYENLLLEL